MELPTRKVLSRAKWTMQKLQENGTIRESAKVKLVYTSPHPRHKYVVYADPEKITAVRSMPEPSNITQVRGFLGTANQLAKFLPDLAEITAPLRDLLRKEAEWHWGDEQQQAFNLTKND